jgi:ATP-dependent protease HslVU (ClpYQ) peptidase subunit
VTTILAVQGDGWAVIGADSQWSTDDGRIGKSTQPKVVSIGKYLVAIAGYTRGANIVQHTFTPPAPPRTQGIKLNKFVVSQFIPAYKAVLESNGIGLPQYDSEVAKTPIDTLMVVNGVIYQIDDDYGTDMDSNRLYAIGSGSDYGLGALQALTDKKRLTIPVAKQCILKALAISAKFDSGTGAPFHVFTQTHGKP